MSVILSYLHGPNVSHSFMDSVMRVIAHENRRSAPILERLPVRCGPISIPNGRNVAAREFLAVEQAEWLWMVDSDMGFADDCLERLLGAADPDARPVVGALCFGQTDGPPDGFGSHVHGVAPTIYNFGKLPGKDFPGFWPATSGGGIPEPELLEVGGTGAACLLMHRSALQSVQDEFGQSWFSQLAYPDGNQIGEDLSFCLRLIDLEIPIFVHTGIRTTHMKYVHLGA